jgi:glycosyltransferase involved in cell wall biosynthesis
LATLSVSMIVKDEPIDRLVMLIDFLRPLTHRFVIADTGSATYEQDLPLLERAGATVVGIQWNDDFSQARNETLQYLDSDWALHLDADEWPSMGLLDFLDGLTRETLGNLQYSDERTMGYLIFTRNFWGGEWGVEVEAHWHTRLFRTAHGRWYKPLHEQVELDGKKEPNTRDSIVNPKLPKDFYIIHSKPREKIRVSEDLYRRMEGK